MAQSSPGLTFRQKMFYGIGEITPTLSGTVVGLLYVFFLTNVVGLPASLAGLVFLLGSIWDGVTDPIAGYLSDITRSRFGRRRVYFLITALPFAIFFFLIWQVPVASQGAMFAYALVSYLLFRTVTTLFIIPYNSYGMEIEGEYDRRTTLQSFKFFFSILFGLVAAALPEIITKLPIDPSIGEGPSRAGYTLMAGIFAIPLLISPLLTFFAFKEPAYNAGPRANLMKKLLGTFKNRTFTRALAMYLCSWVAIGFIQAMLVYFLNDTLGQGDNFAVIALIIMGLAALCLPIWVWISKKLDKRRAYSLGMLVCAVLFALLMLPASVLNRIIWVLLPFIGFGLSAMHMLPGAIMPEAIESGETDPGNMSTGIYYGVITLAEKIGVAAAVQVGSILMQMSGYISTTEGQLVVQPASAQFCIQCLFSLVPVACMLLGMIIARKFSVGRVEATALHEALGNQPEA